MLKPPANPSRSLPLDFLRGVAILLVIGRHYVIPAISANGDNHDAGALWPIAGLWQRFGWTGVDLFFVLSGFLVGGLLCAEARDRGHIDVKRFIIRRGLKIWPLYYLFLLFLAVATSQGYPSSTALEQNGVKYPPMITPTEAAAPLWPSALHFQNYYRVIDVNHRSIADMPRSHLWSLAVEEHFYLVLPLLMLLLLALDARRLRLLPAFAILTIITCTLLRCFTHNYAPFPWSTHVYPTHMRIDGLFFGVLLAYFYHFKPGFQAWMTAYRLPLFLIGLLLIAPMAFAQIDASINAWVPTFGFTMLYLGYGCILLAVLAMPTNWLSSPASSALRLPATLFRAIGWVGLFSYPIYLWHLDLGRFPMTYLDRTQIFDSLPPELHWLAVTALYVTLAVATGALIGTLIEKPTLVLRDKLFPRRAIAVPATPPARPV